MGINFLNTIKMFPYLLTKELKIVPDTTTCPSFQLTLSLLLPFYGMKIRIPPVFHQGKSLKDGKIPYNSIVFV
jgi:hypothetical protein